MPFHLRSTPSLCCLSILFAASVCLQAQPLVEREAEFAEMPLPAGMEVPRIDVPVYMMEYHIWYKSPFGEEAPDGFVHWDIDNFRASQQMGPDWMRDKVPVGYPLVGIYNSEDRGIIRWQLQTMRNAGLSGTLVQMFPNWNKGERFDRVFIWDKVLEIAAEEDYPVAVHDEVQFLRDRPAQDPKIMAQRLGEFIKKYGDHPGYLHIDGQPVLAFQFWSRFDGKMSSDMLRDMILDTQAIAGTDIYWIIHVAPNSGLYAIEEVDSFIPMANTNAMNQRGVAGYGPPMLDWEQMDKQFAGIDAMNQRFPGHDTGLWLYPGFNQSSRELRKGRDTIRWMPRRGGKAMVEVLERYQEQKPDFIMVSSWNDWEENTAMEPGLMYEGYAGDPYLYCRILAQSLGKTFTPAPLPPKESVDPWLWLPLYGIDRTPPIIRIARYLPMRPGLVVSAEDSHSPLERIVGTHTGDAWMEFREAPEPALSGMIMEEGGTKTDMGLALPAGKTVQFKVFSKALEADSDTPVYLALEFAHTAPGRIEATYPCEHELVNWKPGDENRFPVMAVFPMEGEGDPSAAIRLMRGFIAGDGSATIKLKYMPEKETPKDELPVLTRIHVLRGLHNAVEGQRMDFDAPDSQTQTCVIDTPDLKGEHPSAFYLFAYDGEGNASEPVVVHGDQFHPFMNRP